MKAICGYCGNEFEKRTGDYNRAMKRGDKVYCSRYHSGLGRRKNKTEEQKKKEKAAYDELYRATNPTLKSRRAASFKKNYKTEKQREINKQRYPQHLEYLQRPEYKKWKRNYDQKHLAKKDYGLFWECSLLLKELETWLLNHSPDGMHFQMGITNKTQKRKRLWQKTIRQQKNLQPQV